MITKEKITNAVNIIARSYSPEKIILFGSYAYGHPTENSDLDILVIKNTSIPRYKRSKEIRKHLRGLKIPLDLIVYNHQEIDKWKHVKAAFITQVMQNGIVLYEQ